MGKNILLVIAYEGYQHIEYNEPKKIFTAAKYHITTASNKLGNAIAKDGSTTHVDLLIKDVSIGAYDAIYFIGGPGTLEHIDNEDSYTLIRNAVETHKLIGAICLATRILAKSGMFRHYKMTGWDGDGNLVPLYKKYDIEYVRQPIVVDRALITANGPSAAIDFAKEGIKLLR